MKNHHKPEPKSSISSDKSYFHQHKPIILGMGGGVFLGIVMGILLNDPGLGMAFGLAIGSGYWYTLKKGNN